MSDFDILKFQYARYYPIIGLRMRGRIKGLFVFKEYWYGRRVDPLYYPYYPKSRLQLTWTGYVKEADANWKNFPPDVKAFYIQQAKAFKVAGHMRYLKLYLQAKSLVYKK